MTHRAITEPLSLRIFSVMSDVLNPQLLLFSAVFLPLLAALLAPLVTSVLKARAGLLLALSFLPGLFLATLAGVAKEGNPVVASATWVPGIDLSITLRADGYSILFALVVAGIGFLVLAYASAYLGKGERYGRFYSFLPPLWRRDDGAGFSG